MILCGIDVGSCETKCVILKEGRLVAYAKRASLPDIKKAALEAFYEACKKANIPPSLPFVASTGYGAEMVTFSHTRINEIAAIIKGAFYFCKEKFSGIIDVGGEDTKLITLDERGMIKDFLLNDRCSAGTGRFLERMSHTLGTCVEELEKLCKDSKKALSINSTCTVFAESEVISLLSAGEKREEVAQAVIDCVCKNILSLAKSLRMKGRVFLCGGVMQNSAVVKTLKKALKNPLFLPSFPQIIAATGAALCGR